MKTIKSILVPMDFSEHSTSALDFAVDLARRYEASLDLLYVYEIATYVLPDAYVVPSPEQTNQAMNQLEQRLAAAKKDALAAGALRVETHLVQGNAVTEILRFARQRGHDLVVMGTHGRTGLKHVLIGSVAENVVRSAPCAVLTVRAKAA